MLCPDENSSTHDFNLQNSDVFFVDIARDMCEFKREFLNGRGNEYQRHPTTDRVLKAMEKKVESVLASSFWSGLPSSYCAGRFVEYKLEPVMVAAATEEPNFDDPAYLRTHFPSRMCHGDAAFRFMVQFQTNNVDMPLVDWSFHLDPASTGFFELQTEVCDTNVTYAKEHLDGIGGASTQLVLVPVVVQAGSRGPR